MIEIDEPFCTILDHCNNSAHANDGLEFLASTKKLNTDLREAAIRLSPADLRILVDMYYQSQEDRKRSANQSRSAAKDAEPNILLNWLTAQRTLHEKNIFTALSDYAQSKRMGRWCTQFFGVGPVIACGMIANIHIEHCPHVGHLWSYAGLNPGVTYLAERTEAFVDEVLIYDYTIPKKDIKDSMAIDAEVIAKTCARLGRNVTSVSRHSLEYGNGKHTKSSLTKALKHRPWNAKFKTLCWKFADCAVKFSGNAKASPYSVYYLERKALEIKRNETGEYEETAKEILATGKYRRETGAKAAYQQGRLPDAHIHARAMRATAKMFLSHAHHVVYEITYGKPPALPYIITKDPMHATGYMPPFGWPID